jgi:hypothetical protein
MDKALIAAAQKLYAIAEKLDRSGFGISREYRLELKEALAEARGEAVPCDHEYAYEGSGDGGAPWRCKHCYEEAPREWMEEQSAYIQESSDRYCS